MLCPVATSLHSKVTFPRPLRVNLESPWLRLMLPNTASASTSRFLPFPCTVLPAFAMLPT